ncbi:GNAT family N-acetyltransferase [Neobacillus terrae]|uniref:GNAT family N-acetyltransferase n=1 Tax=Neobacillus terrae TaxID=3034837 RepID=UPI00140CD9B9|nr:GNAT family N-acetyltransferase [Neobacillus terrae]NHM32927.1 GNAT family N-acetyltransferase [Neobacillus terrae]
MKIKLEHITRNNWEWALKLRIKDSQSKFTPEVAVSLAKVYIKPDGDNVEYIPFAIYADETMVGFIMHAYEEDTPNMYWINGFLIDERYQGKGYGKAAMLEIIHWIKTKFPQCQEIRLTVYKDNEAARKLYKNLGFLPTGEVLGEEDVFYLSVRRV